jgi:hypothetical protein
MNAASRWRASLVQPLADIYAANSNVAAVLLGGSTARGHADRYSDIELGVFWRHAPAEAEREALAGVVPGDLLRLYPYDEHEEVWSDDFTLGRAHACRPQSGVLLEVSHYTVDYLERTLDAVLLRHDPAAQKQNLLAAIAGGAALHGGELLEGWKARAAVYPRELAAAVVRRYGQIDHFWRYEMWLARGENLMMLYGSFAQVEQQLLHVLLGLNRRYYGGFKWLDLLVEQLPVKPPDLLRRLRLVFRAAPAEGAAVLAALVGDTYALVEREMPEIDVDRLRVIFRYRRPAWDEAPPLPVGLFEAANEKGI